MITEIKTSYVELEKHFESVQDEHQKRLEKQQLEYQTNLKAMQLKLD